MWHVRPEVAEPPRHGVITSPELRFQLGRVTRLAFVIIFYLFYSKTQVIQFDYHFLFLTQIQFLNLGNQ